MPDSWAGAIMAGVGGVGKVGWAFALLATYVEPSQDLEMRDAVTEQGDLLTSSCCQPESA